jgi:hypothetical protein
MSETIFVTNKCTCGKCIYCEFGGTPPATKIEVFRKCESCTELERQNAELLALAEQMREALRLALAECRSTHCENEIRAALAATER